MKKILILLFVAFCFYGNAQYSIGVGPGTFNSLNAGFTRVGLNVFYEKPRNERNTFFLRGLITIPVTSSTDTVLVTKTDINVEGPTFKPVPLDRITSLISVDGGNRTYFYNTYEVGLAIYGNAHFRGMIATYNERLGDYDESIYQPDSEPTGRSWSLLAGFGGNLGVKYQLPYRGSLNFDISADYIRAIVDPSFILGNEIGFLSLSLNLSYRFDWY